MYQQQGRVPGRLQTGFVDTRHGTPTGVGMWCSGVQTSAPHDSPNQCTVPPLAVTSVMTCRTRRAKASPGESRLRGSRPIGLGWDVASCGSPPGFLDQTVGLTRILAVMPRVTWTDGQVAEIAKQIQREYGAHWAFIPETLRPCIVSHYVLSTVLGLDRDAVPPESIATLRDQLQAKVFPDDG